MLLLFARQRCRQLRNSVTRDTMLRRLPFVALGIGFWALFYLGSQKTVAYLLELGFVGDALATRLLSMVFFSLTGFLVLSNIVTALSSFYLSREIPFLLATPLEVRDILRLKTAETVMNSSWMVISFTPPVFIAYGVAYGAGPSYYVAVLACLALLITLTAGVGITIAHLLARVAPARRSRTIILGAGLILMVAAYAVVRSSVAGAPSPPEELLGPLMRYRTDSPLLPGTWIMRTVMPALTGKGRDLFYALVLSANSAFVLMIAAMAGARLYLPNLGRMQPSSRPAGAGILGRSAPRPSTALLFKDLRVFIRDTGQWSQILIIGALVFVYIYNFRAVPMSALAGFPFIREIMLLVNLVLAGLVLSAVAARFVYTSVSLEGRAFWVIRSGPVDMDRFLRQKFLQGAVPVTAVVSLMVLLVNSSLGIGSGLMLLSLGVIAVLCIAVCGLGTGMGAMFPRFEYENIAAVSMGLGAMAFMVLSFTLVLCTTGLVSWAYYLLQARPSPSSAGPIVAAGCVLLAVLLNVAAFALPMKKGAEALRRAES